MLARLVLCWALLACALPSTASAAESRMEARLTLITLPVDALKRAVRFLTALRWQPASGLFAGPGGNYWEVAYDPFMPLDGPPSTPRESCPANEIAPGATCKCGQGLLQSRQA